MYIRMDDMSRNCEKNWSACITFECEKGRRLLHFSLIESEVIV